jgi:hypothetical protein
MKLAAIVALSLAAAAPVHAAFDPVPWLADLTQARHAVDEKYANLEWLMRDRGVDLDAAFARAKQRIEASQSDAEARRAFERLFERFRDGHVEIRWPPSPAGSAASAPTKPAPLCERMGYNAAYLSEGTAQHLAGYRVLSNDVFPTGIVESGGRRVGVIRIGIFMPQGYPALCEQAARDLSLAPTAACDDACSDRLITRAYELMTAAFEQRVRELKRAGAQILLVDLSRNSGGSEWAEAAARVLSRKPLRSAELGFMRGEHWAKQWRELAAELAKANQASPDDAALLDPLIAQAKQAAAEAEGRCGTSPCPRLGKAGYATGLVGSAPAGELSGKPWGYRVFSPAQYGYHDGVWDGPTIVLVDQETWSAAEEFAALLQDNRAAVIMGARTGGAGCGHTNGGTPTTLANSKGVLELPDCVRFRADGSNEVNGIVPDVVVGLRFDDGPAFKAPLIEAKLPEAIAKATALAK